MPFTCITCGITYANKSSSTRHQKMHDGTVFKCEICSKTYLRRDYLVKHAQNVHKFKKYGKSFNEAMGITDLMMGEALTDALSSPPPPPPPPPTPTSPSYISLAPPVATTSTLTTDVDTIAIPAPAPRKRLNVNTAVNIMRKKKSYGIDEHDVRVSRNRLVF
ncbi:zinc finger protein 282-like [Sipha flava]|uniref:Zinc finger protein 282-like n=1 Tax=Sipha flava TaxID=143950 RepID=A0A8B8FA26_9HEMI|nr:zinc finger protein 282-like [Sipha flava]